MRGLNFAVRIVGNLAYNRNGYILNASLYLYNLPYTNILSLKNLSSFCKYVVCEMLRNAAIRSLAFEATGIGTVITCK